ncbi:hypothetical protein TNCV_3725101 [Trichonephila clavipes]|nr:hypothetical protein TNCV_3725101 [Trichonephila clavipes]
MGPGKRSKHSAGFMIKVIEFAKENGNRAAARMLDIGESSSTAKGMVEEQFSKFCRRTAVVYMCSNDSQRGPSVKRNGTQEITPGCGPVWRSIVKSGSARYLGLLQTRPR